MKIYTSKYRNHWISPYTILDYIFFWTDWSKCSREKSLAKSLDPDYKHIEHPEWVETWSERLTPLSVAIQKILDFVHPEIKIIKIDYWDTWSMDHTLGSIALPMLKQLKATKHGSPFVDDEDVPEELKSTSAPPKENEWDTDDNHHLRWEWVIDEMIYAFEHRLNEDWKDQFYSGESDWLWKPVDKDGNSVPKGEHKYYEMVDGPKHTWKADWDGMKVVENRIQNGFRLFGKYYQGLWD
jgi:hypothetical protein